MINKYLVGFWIIYNYNVKRILHTCIHYQKHLKMILSQLKAIVYILWIIMLWHFKWLDKARKGYQKVIFILQNQISNEKSRQCFCHALLIIQLELIIWTFEWRSNLKFKVCLIIEYLLGEYLGVHKSIQRSFVILQIKMNFKVQLKFDVILKIIWAIFPTNLFL